MFSGSIVALVTPFKAGKIDEEKLKKLVAFHLENGTHGIVPVGTTGESPTLSGDEHKRIVEIVTGEVSGQVPVIAGAGSNNTAEALHYHQHAANSGASGALHVVGYYNRPNPEGVYQHFLALNEASELPIVVYNIPPRAIIDIAPETMARLAKLKNVVGVKDATGDLARPLQEARLIKEDFCYLSGDDFTAVAYNIQGGSGCISVVANVAPKLTAELQTACREGNFGKARELQVALLPLIDALFSEPSPAGVKYAGSLLNLCEENCRLPVVELTSETKATIKKEMKNLSLI